MIHVAGVNDFVYYIQFARVKDLLPDTVDNGLVLLLHAFLLSEEAGTNGKIRSS
jgi:hypothetical protein